MIKKRKPNLKNLFHNAGFDTTLFPSAWYKKNAPKMLMGACKGKKSMKNTQSLIRNLLLLPLLLGLVAHAAAADPQHRPPIKQRTTPDYLSVTERQAVDLYRRVLPAVVTVITASKTYAAKRSGPQMNLGSGVLISPQCHVLTAAHVVQKAEKISVKTMDGKVREAEVLFTEPSADIALIKLSEPDHTLLHAKLGDSDRLAVGQIAFAVGSPYGLEHSFSVGHISGFREFDRLYDGTILAEFIQTDAAINVGNSGGPVFNSRGEVIGIASRIISVSGGSQGLGFAVAINTAKKLLALEDRVWIGIEGIFLNAEQIVRLFNRQLEGGLLVERVVKGSPADRAGLHGGTLPAHIQERDFMLGGDLIIQLGSQSACHVECLVEARKHFKGLDRIPVKFLRGGKTMDGVIDVTNSRRNFLKEDTLR